MINDDEDGISETNDEHVDPEVELEREGIEKDVESESNVNIQKDGEKERPIPSSKKKPEELFQCVICLDLAEEPVVTKCGHLYCWKCLYQWMRESQTCPTCKSGIRRNELVPIYGKGKSADLNKDPSIEPEAIPQRPTGQRTEAPPPRPSLEGFSNMFATPFFSVRMGFGVQRRRFTRYPGFMDPRMQSDQVIEREEPEPDSWRGFLRRILIYFGMMILIIVISK